MPGWTDWENRRRWAKRSRQPVSDAGHERDAIVHVAVLLAANGFQRMGVDNGSAGFDARHTFVDDLPCRDWNSGLDPTCRGSIDGDFVTSVLLATYRHSKNIFCPFLWACLRKSSNLVILALSQYLGADRAPSSSC